MIRSVTIATDGALIQVADNQLSYLELKAIFAILDAQLDSGRFPVPSAPLVIVVEAPKEEPKTE